MKTLLVFLLFSVTLNVQAGEYVGAAKYVVQTEHKYMVSGVLRKGTSEMTIRLVHSLYQASSKNEAVGKFTSQVEKDYSGYSILTTLATEVEDESKCDVRI